MKAVFLDRDGVINKYPGDAFYVTKWKDFRFLPFAKEALVLFSQNGFDVFIVSNQAGVGRGIYSRKKLNIITRNMLTGIKKSGGKVKGVYYCTHRREDNCSCRKPEPGSIRAIKRKHNRIKISDSFLIGDTIRDVLTAKKAGCRSILVLSGKEKLKNRKSWKTKPDFVFKNLYVAAKFIISKNNNL